MQDENAVEAALLFNEKKFPPMLPRKLRVMRAKAIKKRPERQNQNARGKDGAAVDRSMQGRASKLLGRAGAAQIRKGGGKRIGNASRVNREEPQEGKGAEPVVFEGHRARAHDRVDGLKVGRKGKGKRKGKPSTRSAKRAAAYRKAQEAK
jgi:nucleolar protein 12